MEKVLCRLGVMLLGLVVAVNALEIFSRTILDHSFYWTQELTVVGCGYVIFFGAAVLFKRKGDILISALYDRLPLRARAIVSIVNNLLILSFLVVAIKSSYTYVRFICGGYTQTMKIPMYMVYLPILICFCSIFLVIVDSLLKEIQAHGPETKGQASI